ncbi:MAG: hypothetical protein P4M08_14305 [Oligoflexia bacterium]|nr:hypothetical protein [Oligoflexia bacterium]
MFASKYPAFTALFALVGGAASILAVQSETLIQKVEGEAAELPGLLAFLPQAGSLGAEVTALKASPTDMEAAAEMLISDFKFSSSKAQSVIAAAFPLAESLVGTTLPQVKALIAAIQA